MRAVKVGLFALLADAMAHLNAASISGAVGFGCACEEPSHLQV